MEPSPIALDNHTVEKYHKPTKFTKRITRIEKICMSAIPILVNIFKLIKNKKIKFIHKFIKFKFIDNIINIHI